MPPTAMKKAEYPAIRQKFLGSCLPPEAVQENAIKYYSINLNVPDDLEKSTYVLFGLGHNKEAAHGRKVDRNVPDKILYDHMIASGVSPETECEKTYTCENAHMNGCNVWYTVRLED